MATKCDSKSTGNRSVVPIIPVLIDFTDSPWSSIQLRRKEKTSPLVSKHPRIRMNLLLAGIRFIFLKTKHQKN
jgi:hypothetical protein